MASIEDDVVGAADAVAPALVTSGYRADFAPASVWELERFFVEHTAGGAPTPGGLLAADTGKRVFAVGCYLGETLRRNLGGRWFGDEDDPNTEVTVTLILPDGTEALPVQQVMQRIVRGDADNVAWYAIALGLEPGPPPSGMGLPFGKRRRFGRRRG